MQFVTSCYSFYPPLLHQAEDVMGSLLTEYLDDSQKQDDTLNPSDNDEKQNCAAENQTTSVNNEADPKDCLNEMNVDTDHACDSIKGEQDLQINNTKDGSAPKKHFKNVVAIVDPPRSGLHPVVSDIALIFLVYLA